MASLPSEAVGDVCSLLVHLDDGELVVELGVRGDVVRRAASGAIGELGGDHRRSHAALAHADEGNADACGDGLAAGRE